MRVRSIALLAALALVVSVTSAWAQTTGEIFGKVTDESGAVLPGVQVTITSPVLLQPMSATTSETGSFQFPRLDVATYTVKFELPGFKTIVKEGIQITVGFNANVSTQMGVSTVQETVTVTGESPIVDTKSAGTKQTFTTEMLQSIPSARDPWVILQQTAGIAMDRENIGGNMSGQQSNYVSRGANPTNNKWSLDGVDITDMSATGASPSYYDFDAFQEITINTGGVDVTQQTGGVGINLVTKSGSDRFRGSSRYYVTDENFESQNISDDLRKQGATSGNPIQNIKDYGVEAGGPIKRGRAWVWGSFGKQYVDVGVLGFYQPTPECQAFKTASVALAASITDVNNCLNTDRTILQTTNLKGEVQLFKGNKLSLFNNFAKKERNARGADDLHPIETTTPQGAVPSIVRQALVEHGCEPDLQVRRPVGHQRPSVGRSAVRARREQLHARVPLSRASRCSADADRLDRIERTVRRRKRVHPAGQQPDVQLQLLPAGRSGRRTTPSRSAATGGTRTRRRSATPAASRPCGIHAPSPTTAR